MTDKQRVSGDLIVVTAQVKGYARPFKVLIDCGATRNYGRKQSVAENNALFAQACERDLGKISVRLATGVVAEVNRIEVELRVAFNDFDSVEHFTVLDMDDRFDLILGMPWLESHEPWIDWRSKTVGSSTPGRNETQARHEPSCVRRLATSNPNGSADSACFADAIDLVTPEVRKVDTSGPAPCSVLTTGSSRG